jgi:predicted nucleotidyltransferase
MELNEDFKEFIKLLNDNKVKYLVVGGYAVGYHGNPRYTKDIDLWLLMDRENAKNIIESIKQFGFESLGLSEEDFLNAENIIQLGYPPNRIDLLTDLSGVDFETSYTKKEIVDFEGVKINFISLDDLIKNKKSTGRLQDLADAENLVRIKK